MSGALAYGCTGLILAGCAAYAFSVLHDRRRGRRTPPEPPAHDTIPGGLSDGEEDAFADLIVTWFQGAS